MNPYEARSSNNGYHARKYFVEFLRTATIFLLDDRETRAALNSRPPDGVALPRLPYRRVWLEWHDVSDVGRLGAPVPLVADEQLQAGQRHIYELLGAGFSELDPGTAWDVFWPIKEIASLSIGPEVAYNVRQWRMTAELLEARRRFGSREEHALIDIAITAADLVTAQNAPRDRVQLPRRQRKQIEQDYADESYEKPFEPGIYYINLRHSGEQQEGTSNHRRSRRRVRWLVRGHWRRLRSGRRTWVRSHIRGPVGAPWKGRPVYGSGLTTAPECGMP
jgi:hypothetical protein